MMHYSALFCKGIKVKWALTDRQEIVMAQNRRPRSDMKVGTFEKKNGLPPGTVRNKDGRDTRSDKRLGTIRKEAEGK